MNMEFEVEKYTIPKMLTVKEAAQEFHIPATAIREWIGEGSLPVVTCGKKYLINACVFSRFLEGAPISNTTQKKPVGVDSEGNVYTLDNGARLKAIS